MAGEIGVGAYVTKAAPDKLLRAYPDVLASHDGKVAVAAQQAGIGRAHFYRLLRKHGLAPGGG